MIIRKGYKYRLYPNSRQAADIVRFIGCCRFVYNTCLALRKDTYTSERRSVGASECMRHVTIMRSSDETAWLAACDSMALQESVKDLDRAYKNFFEKRAGYPRFHSKRSGSQSYHTRNQGGGIRINGKHIVLPKLGPVKAKISRLPNGRILNATVSRTPSGRFFVSLCVEEEYSPKPGTGCLVGIDVGLKEFYTDSNGRTVDNPRYLKKYARKLTREQRKLSRMIEANILKRDSKGRPVWKKPLSECRNIQKQRIRVARIHEKIADTRRDFLHKESSALVNENQVICVEDLNIKGMSRNHRLAKAISDVSWGEFFRQLEYKADYNGAVIIRVPTFYPSSQTCSACGYKNPVVKDLSIRQWTCPVCGTHHDRDVNAAVNILNKGLLMLCNAA